MACGCQGLVSPSQPAPPAHRGLGVHRDAGKGRPSFWGGLRHRPGIAALSHSKLWLLSQVPMGVYSEHLGPFSSWSQTWILCGISVLGES